MRIQLTSDNYYEKAELRECVNAAKKMVAERSNATRLAQSPRVIRISVVTRPRIRKPRASFNVLILPRKGALRSTVTRYVAWMIYLRTHPHLTRTQQDQIFYDGTPLPHAGKPLTPRTVPQAPKGPYVALQKSQKQLAQAEAKIVTLEKQLVRARAHCEKKRAEVHKREHALTRPLKPGDRPSDGELAARIQLARKHG